MSAKEIKSLKNGIPTLRRQEAFHITSIDWSKVPRIPTPSHYNEANLSQKDLNEKARHEHDRAKEAEHNAHVLQYEHRGSDGSPCKSTLDLVGQFHRSCSLGSNGTTNAPRNERDAGVNADCH